MMADTYCKVKTIEIYLNYTGIISTEHILNRQRKVQILYCVSAQHQLINVTWHIMKFMEELKGATEQTQIPDEDLN
jgi:hypothetical protein